MTTPAERLTDRTIADFGEQWTEFRDNDGFYGSAALFDDVFGPLVDRMRLAGRRVAEIGAGTGRFINILLDAGVSHAIAVEPSAAYDVLLQNTAPNANRVTYVRAAGETLEAGLELDYVFSIGVLHHIPDPQPVVRAAFAALRRGGTLAVWLYGREGNAAYLSLALPLRAVTRRLPHGLLVATTWMLDPLLVAYVAACRVAPLPLAGYMREVIARLPGDKRRLVVYDQLNPAYAKYYTEPEARHLLEDAGFVNVQTYHRHGYSWAVTGERP